jgi:hypothetical protein
MEAHTGSARDVANVDNEHLDTGAKLKCPRPGEIFGRTIRILRVCDSQDFVGRVSAPTRRCFRTYVNLIWTGRGFEYRYQSVIVSPVQHI